LAGIIPLNIHGRPVVKIHGFPKRIVTREESAAIDVELIGEYEIIFVAVKTGTRVGVFWGILVYSKGDFKIGDLAGKVDAADVKGGAFFKLDHAVVCDDGIASKKGDKAEEDCEESDIVCPTASAPDGPLRVLDSILAGVGAVKGIVEVWVTGVPEVRGCTDGICLLGRAEWFFCVGLLGEAGAGNRLKRVLGLLDLEKGLARVVVVVVTYSIRAETTANVSCEDAPTGVLVWAAGVERHLRAAAS
jgi:hypothetical protein